MNIYSIKILISFVPACTYEDYGKFYEAAHNNVMTEVVRYVEEHNCCPAVVDGMYGKTALWVAEQRGNDEILAYLKTADCQGMPLRVLLSNFSNVH